MSHIAQYTLSIANGASNGAALSSVLSVGQIKLFFGTSDNIIIYAPAVLTGVVTLQYSPVDSPAAGDWKTVQVNGADVTIAAGKAVSIHGVSARDLRLVSAGVEAAQRDFVIATLINTDA